MLGVCSVLHGRVEVTYIEIAYLEGFLHRKKKESTILLPTVGITKSVQT